MKTFTFAATTAMATCLALALPTQVFAQAADVNNDDSEIIVTARKRAENLIDVPIPVTVVTADQMQRDQVFSLTDLQRVTPALEVSQTSGGEVNGGARIRGLGTGVFNPSVAPSVAFVIDQVPQGNLTFPILFDIAQVEVLRGPQGTLFGQGASAGVINISTTAPTTDGFHVNGGIDYADKGTFGAEVSEMVVRSGVNVPLGEKAAIRVAAHYKKEKGLQRNTFLNLDNKNDEFALRVKALLKPAENFTVNITGEYARQKFDGWNFFAVATTPTNPGSLGNFTSPTGCNLQSFTPRAEFYCSDAMADINNTFGGINLVMDWDVSDAVTLSSVTAYRELDRETGTVNFSRRVGVPAARNENIESESNQFSQELRVAYDSGPLKAVAGVMYSKFKTKQTPIDDSLGFGSQAPGTRTGFSVCVNGGFFCVPVNGPFAPPVSLTFEDTQNSAKAVFADATFSITPQLDIFGGLRYSDYSNTTGTGLNTYAATRTQKIADKDISGRIGISYKPSRSSTLYASFARGYKPPAIVVPTIPLTPLTFLAPEKAQAFELGGKIEVGRLQLSANIFHTKVKNFQIQNQTFVGASLVSVVENISQVTSKGFELGAFGKISDNFSVNAGYQYNDVTYPTPFIGNDGVSLAGSQFINAPKHKFTLSGDFGLPVSDGLEFFTSANLVYKSKVLLGQYGNPVYRYKAHELINGRIGLRQADGKWSAALFVRNLTKEREPTAYLAGDFAGSADGSIRAWPAAGLTARVVGLSVDFKL
jgi:outer membrane receptor protein involved in Fe transport